MHYGDKTGIVCIFSTHIVLLDQSVPVTVRVWVFTHKCEQRQCLINLRNGILGGKS